MSATDGSAAVHLRLRGRLTDDDLTALRQQLATCLQSGITDLKVHVEEQEDLEVPVLQALDGVQRHLARSGGSLTLLGASPGVRRTVAVNGLQALLPEPAATAEPADPVAEAPAADG